MAEACIYVLCWWLVGVDTLRLNDNTGAFEVVFSGVDRGLKQIEYLDPIS
jgi:DNA/RNA endonuclease YhcR with UshA esterase domain